MDAFKIAVKIFAARDVFEPSEFVPVFHRWIQSQVLPDHLLIDVADYAHVPAGPGTVLVSSQANLYTDRAEDRFGLLYSRKLPLEGSFQERLLHVVGEALKAAALLETEPSLVGRLTFKTDELLIRLNDRLLAPNTAETFAATKPDFIALSDRLFGPGKAEIEYAPSPLKVFEVRIKSKSSLPVQSLVERISEAIAT
ncbi:MAG: hypothetical protein ABSH22_17570 [Tepidisphaeraceae bacterium]|jgi:hypothetical protein